MGDLRGMASREEVDAQRHEGRRGDDADVDAELVAQVALLRAGCGDGRVGDEREVVAEEGAADHDPHEPCLVHRGLLGQPCGNGTQGDDRPDGGADGERHEAGREEEPRREERTRQQVEREVHRGIHGAHAAGRLGEGSGEDEDPDHEQNVAVCGSGREVLDAFGEGQPTRRRDGVDRGGEERHADGHAVEVARYERCGEVGGQEDQQGREGQQAPVAGMFFGHDSDSLTVPG